MKWTERPAAVLEDLETALAGSGGVEVNHELIDDALEQRKVPSAAPDLLDLSGREPLLAQAEPRWRRGGCGCGLTSSLDAGGSGCGEPGLDTIGVVSAGVGPQDDARGRVVELTADHDLVTLALEPFGELGAGLVGVERSGAEQYHRQPPFHSSGHDPPRGLSSSSCIDRITTAVAIRILSQGPPFLSGAGGTR